MNPLTGILVWHDYNERPVQPFQIVLAIIQCLSAERCDKDGTAFRIQNRIKTNECPTFPAYF